MSPRFIWICSSIVKSFVGHNKHTWVYRLSSCEELSRREQRLTTLGIWTQETRWRQRQQTCRTVGCQSPELVVHCRTHSLGSRRQNLQHSSGYHPTVISVEMKKLTDCPRLEVKKPQFRHPISYPEIKTLIQHKIRQEWCHQHNITGEDTSLMDLERWQQTIIFRLRIASKCHHQWNVPVAQEHKTQKTYYKNVLHTPSREHALGQYQWTLETSYGEPNVNWSTPHSSSGTYKSWSTVFERRRRRSIQQISDECARRGSSHVSK